MLFLFRRLAHAGSWIFRISLRRSQPKRRGPELSPGLCSTALNSLHRLTMLTRPSDVSFFLLPFGLAEARRMSVPEQSTAKHAQGISRHPHPAGCACCVSSKPCSGLGDGAKRRLVHVLGAERALRRILAESLRLSVL